MAGMYPPPHGVAGVCLVMHHSTYDMHVSSSSYDMAVNLEAVARNMKSKFGTKVQVPVPLLELTRKHVLVMSFLPGRTLVAAVQDELAAVIGRGGFVSY